MPSSKAYTRIECLLDYWSLPHASTCKTYGGPNWLHRGCQRVVSRLPTTPHRNPHRTAGRSCGAGVPRAIVAHDSSDRRRSDRCSPRGGARHRSAGGLHSTCGAVARSPAGTRTGSRAGGHRPPGPPGADRAVRCGTTRRGGASGSSRPANEPTFQPWPHLGASRPSLFPKEPPGASPPLTGPDAAGATFGGLSTSYVWKTGGRRPTTFRPGCGRTMANSLRTGGGSVVFSLVEFRRKTRSQGWLRVGLTSLVIHTAMIGAVVYATLHAAPRDTRVSMDTTVVLLAPQQKQRPLDPPPVQLADALKGFQTVAVPTQIPTDIPPVDLQQRFDPKDYSGSGIEGGRANGIVGSGSEVYAEALVEERPELLSAPPPIYPQLLKQAGIQGRVILHAIRVFINLPVDYSLTRSAGSP